MVVQDFDSVFCCVLFKGKLGSKCYVRLVVKLEVGEFEVAEVVNKDIAHL
jgi:hypothetical protein